MSSEKEAIAVDLVDPEIHGQSKARLIIILCSPTRAMKQGYKEAYAR